MSNSPNVSHFDPRNRDVIYLEFAPRSDGPSQRVLTSTRVANEYPLITIDYDQFGEPMGVLVHTPIQPPEPNPPITQIKQI